MFWFGTYLYKQSVGKPICTNYATKETMLSSYKENKANIMEI